MGKAANCSVLGLGSGGVSGALCSLLLIEEQQSIVRACLFNAEQRD